MSWRPQIKRRPVLFGALAVGLIIGGLYAWQAATVIATIDILDVGQGDAILVSSGRTQLLIDAGPDRSVLAGLGRHLPLLDRTIEAFVLTHPHADHRDGLTSTAERYRIASTPTPVRGESFVFENEIRFDVLWPPAGREVKDPNDRSVVLRMSVPGMDRAAALFTGDATLWVESELMTKGDDLSATLLKVGHHGSRYSSSAAFLAAVRPAFAAISVGRNNYGHPALAALRRLEATGAQVSRTDHEGDIRYIVRRKNNEVILERKNDFIYNFSNIIPR